MIYRRLRAREIDDSAFDLIYPETIRELSDFHWSPIRLATRAAELAVAEPGAKVLDVGAGPGKFCIVGSCVTEGVFFGIEQRHQLVAAARDVVNRYKLSRVHFDHGNMIDYDWRPFDCIYLYNPFSENLDRSIRIDDTCELSNELYVRYIRAVQEKLAGLATGVRVVTLNGFGGDFPPSFRLLHREEGDVMPLELRVKS
ncbi:MAG: methyltransferase domain-containing protein [Pseudobdellovibrionaceae bacterium]